MNEVEKMYRNCNIKPKQKGYCGWDSNCPYPHHKCNDECPYWKHEDIAKYPPFTAEKQLELIKKLGNINIDIDNGCYMSSEILEVEAHCDTFEETLAEFVNNLWQDLSEEEKRQITDILKG